MNAEAGGGIPFAAASFLKDRKVGTEQAASSGEPKAGGGTGEKALQERQASTDDRGTGSSQQQ